MMLKISNWDLFDSTRRASKLYITHGILSGSIYNILLNLLDHWQAVYPTVS
jgi:hypothetical protein